MHTLRNIRLITSSVVFLFTLLTTGCVYDPLGNEKRLEEPWKQSIPKESSKRPMVDDSDEPIEEGNIPSESDEVKVKKRQSSRAVGYLLQKAQTEFDNGEYDRASNLVERAYRISPKEPDVSYSMAKILLEQGQPKKAEQWALQGLSLVNQRDRESRSKFWRLISNCRAETGDLEGANEAQKRADL